jgi:hypothetical protein
MAREYASLTNRPAGNRNRRAMIKLLHSFWRQTPLGRILMRGRRDEHRHQLERTRRAAEAAQRETQLWLRSRDSPLSAAAMQRSMALDARWQHANHPDDSEQTAELRRLEAEFDAFTVLVRALWRLDTAAEEPRCWVQELLADHDGEAPSPRATDRRRRSGAAPVADPARLTRLAEQLVQLDQRYQRLVSELPTTEQLDLVAGVIEPLERGFRQLGEEAYPLWAARFPERARAAGKELADAVVQRLRRHQQPAPVRGTTARTRSDDVELFEDEATAPEEER